MVDYSICSAKEEDLDAIENLLYPRYFEESFYNGLEYDSKNCREFILSWLESDCLIAKSNGNIVAVTSLEYYKTYYRQEEAVVEMFYVSPEFRGTALSRELLKSLINLTEKRNVAMLYASCASGMGQKNDALYSNLFQKFGFEVLGTDLIKKNF